MLSKIYNPEKTKELILMLELITRYPMEAVILTGIILNDHPDIRERKIKEILGE